MANKPEIKKEKMHGGGKERKTKQHFLKRKGGKKCQQATRQRLDTRNLCTQYNPFSQQQHGRATDAHKLPQE